MAVYAALRPVNTTVSQPPPDGRQDKTLGVADGKNHKPAKRNSLEALAMPLEKTVTGPATDGQQPKKTRRPPLELADRTVTAPAEKNLTHNPQTPAQNRFLTEGALSTEGFPEVHRQMIERINNAPGRQTGDQDDIGISSTDLPPTICFAEGTDPKIMGALQKTLQDSFVKQVGDAAFAAKAFQLGQRWSWTALMGTNSNSQGEAVVLTWGMLPDGINIPSGVGEPSSPNNLINRLNAIYYPSGGAPNDITTSTWFALFELVFDRWSELGGVRYVYEPNDDSASFPSSRGISGTRPDIRIGGHFIDGNSNTLAYNFFPNNGDMVIDTADNTFTSTNNNSRFLRNTLSHEHGHGLGFNHVCPINRTKLMEPFLSTQFDGPQLDDIFSVNRQYGDRLEDMDIDNNSENNDAPSRAHDLETISTSTTLIELVSIDDNSDTDYYRFTLPSGTDRANVTVTPSGGNNSVGQNTFYLEGSQNNNGSCSAGTNINILNRHDLSFQILDTNGSTVLFDIDDTSAGNAESISGAVLPSGPGPFFVRVSGDSSNTCQLYDLEIAAVEAPPSDVDVSIASAGGGENEGVIAFPVTLDTAADNPVQVQWQATSGTATAGTDFSPISGSITIASGELESDIFISPTNDSTPETNEDFTVTLSSASNANISASSAPGTIFDDDAGELLDDTLSLNFPAGTNDAVLQWEAVPGRVYNIDFSLNLLTWMPLPGNSNITATMIMQTVTDTGGTAGPRRFYRVTDPTRPDPQ